MSNLFLQSMTDEQVGAIEKVKQNKVFTLRLIKDLGQIFHTNETVRDEQNSVRVSISAYGQNRYENFIFHANKNGVTFSGKVLGYREVDTVKSPHIKPLGALYEKYKTDGGSMFDGISTVADNEFLSDHGHGEVQFTIKIEENSSNLQETLRDIIYLLEKESFKKRF
jgi:hypothetical protein